MININKITAAFLPMLAAGMMLVSCNKDVKQFDTPAPGPYPSGKGIAATIAANPDDSLFYRMILRAGYTTLLNDSTKKFTIFAVNNDGMKLFVTGASGGLVPATATLAQFSAFIANTLPVASAQGVLNYNTIGQLYPFSSIPVVNPNFPLLSQIQLDPTIPFIRSNIFVAKGTTSYLNTLPITAVDQAAANGIIHHSYSVVTPPTRVLKDTITRTANTAIYLAAIARADSGQVGTARFDSLLNYGLTNMTVLVPRDTAFKTLINALSGGLVPLGAPNSTFIGFLNTNVSAATVRGIMAYHFLASNQGVGFQPNIRVFSVNFPATSTLYQTLVNASVAVHPGVRAQATYTGPFATALTFTGLGNLTGGAPYTGPAANVISSASGLDRHGVNGVFYLIDRILLPQ